MLLDTAGRRALAGLCGVPEEVLERALPAWGVDDEKLAAAAGADGPRAVWRVAGAAVGPAAFGCRSCAARRTGAPVRVVRYAPRWERVCARHGRWLLDADADHGLEFLDVRGLPEIAEAQRQWVGMVRRAQRGGVEAAAVFAVARAVVCQWWDHALGWEQERIWPARLHRLAGGDAGPEFWWWRAVAREAATFPEVVAVAGALVDPVVAELVWQDSGGERIRPFPPDGALCQELGRRLARPWLGEVGAVPDSSALTAWWGALVRRRRGAGQSGERFLDPWWVKREDQPVSVAAQLRKLAQRAEGTISWRSAVPADDRARIQRLIREAAESLEAPPPDGSGQVAAVSRDLLQALARSAELVGQALLETTAAALQAGVPLQVLGDWSGTPAEVLRMDVEAYQEGQRRA
ncbi:DNA-binding protein [Kitasatospora purpeofusca]|uniref:DNA-binding protein n=1 Tax=Kitasatospora purpeofusca TaxID=67352 RepID=UPI002A5A1C47|nr:DNA-binding protein [Kitasatospora purpeofusca]MDY0816251.1 DNA-binding protein [Kitasatospora purpeofusca]